MSIPPRKERERYSKNLVGFLQVARLPRTLHFLCVYTAFLTLNAPPPPLLSTIVTLAHSLARSWFSPSSNFTLSMWEGTNAKASPSFPSHAGGGRGTKLGHSSSKNQLEISHLVSRRTLGPCRYNLAETSGALSTCRQPRYPLENKEA